MICHGIVPLYFLPAGYMWIDLIGQHSALPWCCFAVGKNLAWTNISAGQVSFFIPEPSEEASSLCLHSGLIEIHDFSYFMFVDKRKSRKTIT